MLPAGETAESIVPQAPNLENPVSYAYYGNVTTAGGRHDGLADKRKRRHYAAAGGLQQLVGLSQDFAVLSEPHVPLLCPLPSPCPAIGLGCSGHSSSDGVCINCGAGLRRDRLAMRGPILCDSCLLTPECAAFEHTVPERMYGRLALRWSVRWRDVEGGRERRRGEFGRHPMFVRALAA